MTDKTQEPVAWINWCAATGKRSVSFECESELASQPLYEGITQNTQSHYSKFHSWFDSELHRQKYTNDHPAYLAAQEAWNAANDAAQHRINRLNAEIEAWKVRFKIAEDALAKLNGPEQKPVAWVYSEGLEALKNGKPWTAYGTKQEANNIALYLHPTPECEPYAWVTFTPYGDEDDVWYENPEGQLLEGWTYKPLYDTTPPQPEPVIDKSAAVRIATSLGWEPKRTWVGLTDEEIAEMHNEIKVRLMGTYRTEDIYRAIEAKLKEKNHD